MPATLLRIKFKKKIVVHCKIKAISKYKKYKIFRGCTLLLLLFYTNTDWTLFLIVTTNNKTHHHRSDENNRRKENKNIA